MSQAYAVGGSNDQLYLDALETEKQSVALAIQADKISRQPDQTFNPQIDDHAAAMWQKAEESALAARTFEELHGGVYAQSGRDTNTTLLAPVGLAKASAGFRQTYEAQLKYAAADRAKKKRETVIAPQSPTGGGRIPSLDGWRPPADPAEGAAATRTELGPVGLLALLGGLGYLAWRILR